MNALPPRDRRPRRGRRGFTLIELLVAIAILGILGTVVISKVWDNIDEARQTGTKTKVDMVHQQVESYRRKHNATPQDLNVMLEADVMNNGRAYFDNPEDLLDAWNNPLYILPYGDGRPGEYQIVSYGANGVQDGYGIDLGLDRDISSKMPLNPVSANR
jgi:general secretion pathway protein G